MEGAVKNHDADACPVLGKSRPTHTMRIGLYSHDCCKTRSQRCCARTRWSSRVRLRVRRRRNYRRRRHIRRHKTWYESCGRDWGRRENVPAKERVLERVIDEMRSMQ